MSFLGGLRVTNPTIRLACLSVRQQFACKILIALGPNLYHGCIAGVTVSWLSSKMDDLDLFFEVMGVDFNMKISNFHL